MELPAIRLYVGEARLLAITVSRGGVDITPDASTFRVVDSDGEDVIPTSPAGISGTQVYYLIGPSDVTAAAGGYKAIWTITRGDEVFIATQQITVQSL